MMHDLSDGSSALSAHLKGIDKTTALLLLLDKPVADKIIKQLDNAEIVQVAKSAAGLGTVGQDVLDTLVDELSDSMTTGMELVGSPDEAQRLITGNLPDDQASDVMLDVHGDPKKAVWSRLERAPEATVADFLQKESAQVASYVLSKLPPGMAASVISHMETEIRNELTRRMLSLKPTSPGAEQIIVEHLNATLIPKLSGKTGPGIHARMADILNKLDREKMDEVLKNLEQFSPEEAEIVRGLLFTFEDIVKLTPENRAKLFDEVSPDVVVPALRGVQDPLLEAVLSSLSARGRRMIEQELRSGAKLPKKTVMQARRTIAEFALELAEKKVIVLQASDEEDDSM